MGSRSPLILASLTLIACGPADQEPDARVVRVTLASGEAQPLHQGLPRLVYSLTPYTIRYTEVGHDPAERSFQAGDAHWHEAGEHAVENTGATEARYVVFQFRR